MDKKEVFEQAREILLTEMELLLEAEKRNATPARAEAMAEVARALNALP